MEDLIERIKKNEEKIRKGLINKGKQKGKKEGIIEIITNMLSKNEDEEKIMEYTNVEIEEIRKIKRQLKIAN